jgi:predicted RNA-binding protein with PIN domain
VTTGREPPPPPGQHDPRQEVETDSGISDQLSTSEVEIGALPEPVRRRVIRLAADALGALAPDEVPPGLRPFARFTGARRLRHGGPAVAAALSTDPDFRARVAESVAESAGHLAEAVTAGVLPAAADPADVAALTYLLRPDGWTGQLAAAVQAVRDQAGVAEETARTADVQRLADQLERVRTQSRAEAERHRAEVSALRADLDRARARIADLGRDLKAAEADARRTAELLATEKGRVTAGAATAEAEIRRLRARLTEMEEAAAAARQGARDTRSADDARLWLLVETIGQAAQGLRRELALGPPTELPGDRVASDAGPGAGSGSAAAGVPVRALAADDPARLDQLLALPRVHLVVDGYNVTKTEYGQLPLEQQRARLVTGLAALRAQTRAEVTVVFDGAERLPAAPPTPRGIRVLFSPVGQTADEMIRRLVRAEPTGRPVAVVSSDREVADGVRRAGAHAVGAVALVRRLSRP